MNPITPMNKSAGITELADPKSLSSTLSSVIPQFQNHEGKFLTEHLQLIQIDGVNFYGIHRDDQMKESVEATSKAYHEIKSYILAAMKLHPETLIYEVVGDSAPYSLEGTKRTKEFLKETIPLQSLVLYGYTGHFRDTGARCVNASVSDFIMEENRPTMGNLVGFHTPAALEKWGCSGPDLNHYFVVYGDNESCREHGTVFGDDVTSSDYIADHLLLCEGGIQSFRQACNFLLLERSVTAISDLRSEKTRAVEGVKYFAASEFLAYVKEKVSHAESEITDKILNEWYEDYFHHHLFSDPKRNDADTKKKLMHEAWAIFVDNKLHEKLHLVSFA